TITDAFGRITGYEDSIAFSMLPGAIPIIPVTGRFHPPIGYHLPDGEYSVRMHEFSDSLTHFYAFTDSLIYGFERSGTQAVQTDYLRMGNGLSFRNPDPATKTIHLSTVIIEDTSSEKVYYIDDMAVSQGDSLRMRALNHRDLMVTNVGGGKTYDLRLTLASTAGESNFAHADVVLDSTSTHFIVPMWDSLRTRPVRILIDRGNNGTIDDSVFVVNQATNVDPPLAALPHDYRLDQNYPNPFNPSTTIRYSLPSQSINSSQGRVGVGSHVTLKVFDMLGREVATLVNEIKQPGTYTVRFDASNVASGMYFYQLKAGSFVAVKKLMLVR
ncbi:MAG: T9SS type A sorting domain-containing protein, partial [Bacteroidota bacterium]